MATNKFLTLVSGIPRLVQAVSTSSGVANANDIVATGADGKIDSSLLPASGSSLAAWDYIQSSVPSSPTNGQRWLELDSNGFPIEGWYRDTTNSRWLSVNIYYSSRYDWGVGSTQNAQRYPFAVPGSWSSLVLVAFNILFTSGSNHSGSNIWTFQPGYTSNGSNTLLFSGGVTLSSNGYTANTQGKYETVYTTPINVPSVAEGFCNLITKGGTAANLFLVQTSGVRKVR